MTLATYMLVVAKLLCLLELTTTKKLKLRLNQCFVCFDLHLERFAFDFILLRVQTMVFNYHLFNFRVFVWETLQQQQQ